MSSVPPLIKSTSFDLRMYEQVWMQKTGEEGVAMSRTLCFETNWCSRTETLSKLTLRHLNTVASFSEQIHVCQRFTFCNCDLLKWTLAQKSQTLGTMGRWTDTTDCFIWDRVAFIWFSFCMLYCLWQWPVPKQKLDQVWYTAVLSLLL